MKICGKILIIIQFATLTAVSAQDKIHLRNDGTVPVWLTNGPFEIETTGFGDLSDKMAIDEVNAEPAVSLAEKNPSAMGGSSEWNYLTSGENGYTDIKDYYGWKTLPGTQKIWYQKVVYAFADIYSPGEQRVVIKSGGNTIIKMLLNGQTVYSSSRIVNAQKDNFSTAVTLRKGENRLLLKIANSHKNHAVSYIFPTNYEWGFYLRLTGVNNENLRDVAVAANAPEVKSSFRIIPTYFYKKIGKMLKQKYLVEINSGLSATADGEVSFRLGSKEEKIRLSGIKFGLNEKEFYIPEVKEPVQVQVKLSLGSLSLENKAEFKALPKYELYYMPTSHMDIGYTNPQPIVIERQLSNLDQVVEKCLKDKNFKWTIETLWLLDNYRQSRSSEKFESLINLIKKGQVAVSPIYTNPFTGWISENEMAESFRWAQEYKEKYGISYYGAVYNDVPGQSWALPQALRKAGVSFLADGLNEIFSGYKFQKSLPKVFNWAGSSQDTVTLYLTEAYTEGINYGLQADTGTIANRTWHVLNNLNEREYPFNKVLISGSLSDNSGIALDQYDNIVKWNSAYEYPKFVVSTLNDFFRELNKDNLNSLKTIRGDWTSDWDILNQGETKRMLKYRWVQNQLPSAEVLSSLSSLESTQSSSFANEINSVYDGLLHFSGHGSGLEYGFGSARENIITDQIREGYVQSSYLLTNEILQRSLYRLTSPKESFDSHGIMVYNTLSWKRTIPVEIEFPVTDLNSYSVIDLSTNTEVSSFRSGSRLYFLAENVPGIGYKQYQLSGPSGKAASEAENDGAAENEYYKISLTEKGLVITAKSSGKNILRTENDLRSFMPVRKIAQEDEGFKNLAGSLKLEGTEKNSVYEEVSASYDNEVFKQIKFRLWKKVNRIDVKVTVNLNGLKKTAHAEEYGLPFVLGSPADKVSFDALGGFMTPEERFTAAGHQSFAVRRVIDIKGSGGQYFISSPDCRIFTIDTTDRGNFLVANVLNNFPESWNRNEDTDGTLKFHFSIALEDNKADASVFGYEVCTEPAVRRSWYKKDAPVKEFISLSNPAVKLISFRPVEKQAGVYQLILQNSSPEMQSLTVSSGELLSSSKASEVNYIGKKLADIPVVNKSFELKLSPNSIKKIMVRKYHN